MLHNQRKRQSGFTIIEVLIVLAIAGLIMLVVFLAVPALQRNSRNTQRKSDISAILGAVQEYTDNNQGTLPATAASFNAAFTTAQPKLGYYTTAANVTWTLQTTATAPTDPNNLDKVKVVNYAKCNGNAATATGATARSIIVLYDVEGSGGSLVPQCQES